MKIRTRQNVLMALGVVLVLIVKAVGAHRGDQDRHRDPLCREVRELIGKTEGRSDLGAHVLREELVEWEAQFCTAS